MRWDSASGKWQQGNAGLLACRVEFATDAERDLELIVATGPAPLDDRPGRYWFDVLEGERTERVLAVFFGRQDHVRHMLERLLSR